MLLLQELTIIYITKKANMCIFVLDKNALCYGNVRLSAKSSIVCVVNFIFIIVFFCPSFRRGIYICLYR